MAARIDARMKQLEALKLLEVEILSQMADFMPDFHHLMLNAAGPKMDALCAEFSGFYRFAKILETLAAGIATGKTKVPGGRTVSKEHKIAAAIDQRVRQLDAKASSSFTVRFLRPEKATHRYQPPFGFSAMLLVPITLIPGTKNHRK